ncbi:hypothetical protein WA026_001647 [Henosepilachna vigintioctopunctata]|uniref:Ribosomal protein eL8/eL30/eS12/Gadd45 domain-containing protein n=1 Tax=Henosepilachna vigintioctopunctata TaxID=420089 RepID=A0AAW1UQY4_9CUCU
METPVLTRLQKKLSLSGKKQKKEIIKNVMDNPHKAYWPLISEELTSFNEVLTKNLPRVRVKKVNVPWKVLKDISKDDRRKAREDYIKKNYPAEDVTKEENLVFGVNDVTKSLETDSCSVVLVAEVTPRILIKHIIDLCILHKVPILVIPGMRQVLEESCGLKSIALAIKRSLPKESNINNVIEAVQKISKKYPVDSLHLNSHKLNTLPLHKEEICNITSPPNEEVIEKIGETKLSDYYLHRQSLSERVFIPNSENTHRKRRQELINDVISITSETDNSNICDNGSTLYKPLKVKRLKGNKNRRKDKIQKLKSKNK